MVLMAGEGQHVNQKGVQGGTKIVLDMAHVLVPLVLVFVDQDGEVEVAIYPNVLEVETAMAMVFVTACITTPRFAFHVILATWEVTVVYHANMEMLQRH